MSEDNQYVIGASMDEFPQETDVFKEQDPFNKTWDELKGLSGLDNNFKRRASRIAKGEVTPQYMDSALAVRSGKDGAKSKEINPGTIYRNGYGLFDVITPPWNLYELASFYDTSFANHAAIDAKVENIVGLGYDFEISPRTMLKLEAAQAKTAENARKRIERAKVELTDWLESLNQEDSFTTIMEKVYTDVQATGNGYIEVGRTVKGQIGYIGHIPAVTMRVRRLRDGFVQVIGNKVVYFRNFGATNPNPVTADNRPNEIIHFKNYTPTNGFYGVPDIISSKNAMAGNEFAARFNLDYFENKAVPRYIITVKGAKLSNDAERKLLEFFQTGLKGKNHRSLYIPLPSDNSDSKVEFKMEAVEAGVQDSSFDKYKSANRDEILMSHRVPISKIGTPQGVSLANAKDADKTFKEQVCRPSQRTLEKRLGKIIAEKTDMFLIKFNELTLTDEDTQSKIDERYLRMKVIVPNEIRARMGLQGLSGGDVPVELNPKAAAEATAQATGNRQRDQERQANQADNDGSRNAQGEGRQTQ